jgi:hypothetical protein
MRRNLEIQSLCTNKLTDNTEPLLQGKTEKNGEKDIKGDSLSFLLFSLFIPLLFNTPSRPSCTNTQAETLVAPADPTSQTSPLRMGFF